MKKLSTLVLLLLALSTFATETESVWQQEGKWRFEPIRSNEKYLEDVYNYDVGFYTFNIDVTDTINQVTKAEVIISGKATVSNAKEIIIDFARKVDGAGFNLTVDSLVFYAEGYDYYPINQSTQINWTDNKRIKITLPTALNIDEEFAIRFIYHGKNLTTYFPEFDMNQGVEYKTVSNKAVIQTYSCPEGSSAWFPCKDLPSDKALFEMNITTWAHQKAVSNGKLVSEIPTKDGKKVTCWVNSYPISTYLIFFAASSYMLYEQSYTSLDGKKQMPILNYLYPSTYSNSLNGLSQMPDMIKALALRLGEYPFIDEKAGNISYVLGGGMEHQTIPAIQSSSFTEMLLLHELSHQWIGDQTTCKTWNDAWINEGGASYCEALWKEYKLGFSGYKTWMNTFKNTAISSAANKPLLGFLPTFNSVIYHKGAWIYHMLRYLLGDDVYFAAQKKLLSQSSHSYGNVSTDEFFNFFSAESGKDLNWFKNQWILKGGYPKYSFAYQVENGANDAVVKFQVKQTQTVTAQIPYFKMPIPVLVNYEDNTDTLLVLNDSLNYQQFSFNLPKKAKTTINYDQFNSQEWILCSKAIVPFVGIENNDKVAGFELYQNYPNPFNCLTTINYQLGSSGIVKLAVYNVKGEMVRELICQKQQIGKHTVSFDASGLNSGVYYVKLKTGQYEYSKKMLLVK